MSSNAQRTPLGRSLNRFTEKKINDALQLTGRALPCTVAKVTGAIITVNFEINSQFTLPKVAVPLFGPEYIRYPIQKGDKGVVFAADAQLGAMSGLGGGTANLEQPSNLAALVFFPISNKTWTAVDPDAVTIYGPNGAVLRDTGSKTVMTLTPNGISVICQNSFSISTGSTAFTMNSDGTVDLKDSSAHTSPAIMAAAWNTFIMAFNLHNHESATPGSPTSPPLTPYTGGNIAPS